MKRLIVYAAVFCGTILHFSIAQMVVIKGTLRCTNGATTSTKGAVNIIIIPSFNPTAAVATTTTPQGYFQINTGWDAKELIDKDVSLYIITKCSSCKTVQRIFISEDLDKRNTDPTRMYVTIKGWKILENCKNTELADVMSERLLDSAHRLPAIPITGSATGSPALLPASFINLFEKLVTVASTGGNVGLFKTTSISPGKIQYGKFLMSSALANTDNTGFNFSPSRNLSEAVFWNAAAISNTNRPNNVSLLANFKNNIKLSGYQQVTKQLYVGLGGIYTQQGEFRQIGIRKVSDPTNKLTVAHGEKLQEFAAFVAPVYKINNRMSAGITIKSIWQYFNNPNLVAIETNISNVAYNFFLDDTIKIQRFDADVSLNYKITSFIQAGISVMNIAGATLHSNLFIKDSNNARLLNQRAYGIGLCYKRERLNVGIDALLTDKDLYDVSAGVNYVPFNNALIAAGYAFKQKNFSVSFRLKHFKISYINDNHLVINETKQAKSKLFDGKIYTGFVFDF